MTDKELVEYIQNLKYEIKLYKHLVKQQNLIITQMKALLAEYHQIKKKIK
jgi:hypothetical protein